MAAQSEIETTINIYGGESTAHIYTNDRRYITKLDKLVKEHPDECTFREDYGSFFYTVPATYIKISPKRRTNLSEEDLLRRRERMRNLRNTLAQTVQANQMES